MQFEPENKVLGTIKDDASKEENVKGKAVEVVSSIKFEHICDKKVVNSAKFFLGQVSEESKSKLKKQYEHGNPYPKNFDKRNHDVFRKHSAGYGFGK